MTVLILDHTAADSLILDPAASDWLVLVSEAFAYFPAEGVFCLCAAELFAVEVVAAAAFVAGVECFASICCEGCQ